MKNRILSHSCKNLPFVLYSLANSLDERYGLIFPEYQEQIKVFLDIFAVFVVLVYYNRQ